MAGMCCGIVTGDNDPKPVEPAVTLGVRRRRMEVRPQMNLMAAAAEIGAAAVSPTTEIMIKPAKKQKLGSSHGCDHLLPSPARECRNARDNSDLAPIKETVSGAVLDSAKFGVSSVRGRRRDMEDAVSMRPSFCSRSVGGAMSDFHFYGVFDGHGCSHVAMNCKARMHEIIKEEIEMLETTNGSIDWKGVMERSFIRMDTEVSIRPSSSTNDGVITTSCRCELRSPQCDAVGSTAVVAIVTPNEIIVSNCGDSRAILCQNGVAVPLSSDHKPDRPDELDRIESAGGRVIYWDGPRVLGVLAMSRAIGDNYLKPYVIPEPEVTVTPRTGKEECLILASDGLWDVVTNQTAAGVARMCLKSADRQVTSSSEMAEAAGSVGEESSSDKACLDASLLLTRLALARHSTDNISVAVADLRRRSGL